MSCCSDERCIVAQIDGVMGQIEIDVLLFVRDIDSCDGLCEAVKDCAKRWDGRMVVFSGDNLGYPEGSCCFLDAVPNDYWIA
ncbi:hypothetical protein BN3658_01136 [Coriobacteriaceae bacterium CHKCI002]|nr:hypothetical protein BN3658_01136 [Coriobacteriaceae bacterium CHKCI002]